VNRIKSRSLKSEPDSKPKPSDFPLGSPESRAAARLQLSGLVDKREWVTLYLECDGDRIVFGDWTESPNHSLMLRKVQLPLAWATLPVDLVPACAECGEPYAEQGRFETTVYFQLRCVDWHDPAPPPKNRAMCKESTVLSEEEKRRAGQSFLRIHELESAETPLTLNGRCAGDCHEK
jgi:hypothetical protein